MWLSLSWELQDLVKGRKQEFHGIEKRKKPSTAIVRRIGRWYQEKRLSTHL